MKTIDVELLVVPDCTSEAAAVRLITAAVSQCGTDARVHRSIVVSHQRQRELPRMTQRVHNEVLSVAGVLGIMERRYRDGLDGRYIGCCFVADLEGHGVSIVC